MITQETTSKGGEKMREHAIITMAAGPNECTNRTLRALSRQQMYHYDPEFLDVHDETTGKLKKLYRTKNDVVMMKGDALLPLEAAAACTIDEGDKCLNLVSGVYGHLYAFYLQAYGAEVIEVRTDFNKAIDPTAVEKAFKDNPDIKIMTMVHCDTPSGTVNSAKEIMPIAKKHGAITILDAVSTLGGVDIETDQWGIDLCIAAPEKCIGGTSALGLVSISEDAWEKMRKKKAPVQWSYLSMLDYKNTWLVEKAKRRFPMIQFSNEIVAFNDTLDQLFEEGTDAVIKRHDMAAKMCRAGVKAMGLKLWADTEDICANCVTAIKTPDGMDEAKLRRHMYDKYRVLIAGGFGDLMGKLFRIGHMGKMAQPVYVVAALAMLEKSLKDIGYPVREFGKSVGAALKAI